MNIYDNINENTITFDKNIIHDLKPTIKEAHFAQQIEV